MGEFRKFMGGTAGRPGALGAGESRLALNIAQKRSKIPPREKPVNT